MLERGVRVKAQIVADRKKQQLDPIMTQNVAAGSHIMTDEMTTYGVLSTPYNREIINHAVEYVNGQIHVMPQAFAWRYLHLGRAIPPERPRCRTSVSL